MNTAINIVVGMLFSVLFTFVIVHLATTEDGPKVLLPIGFLLYGYIAFKAGWLDD